MSSIPKRKDKISPRWQIIHKKALKDSQYSHILFYSDFVYPHDWEVL